MKAPKPHKLTARELSALEYYSQVSSSEVCRLFGISRTTLWKWVKAGRIPEPRYVELREPRWRLGELVALLEGLPKMQDAARGLQAAQDNFSPGERPKRKGNDTWKRLGLSRPKDS